MVNMLAGTAVACTSLFTAEVGGQTLFARPDTTPNFASYRYLEECENAILRVTDELETRKDPVWYDTMSIAMQRNDRVKRAMNRRPETAINAATVCLKKFNADTVRIKGLAYAGNILNVLLMAHRDHDAQRFAQRLLDSVRQQSEWDLRDARSLLVEVFGRATPVRLDDAKRYYAEQLALLKNDSLRRTVYAAYAMSQIADMAGDTALFEETAWHAIRTLDAIPAKERPTQFGGIFLGTLLTENLRRLTKDEALDSLAISTIAYKSWEANTVNARIYGDEERKTPKDIDLSKVTDLVGEHYYVASNYLASKPTPDAKSPDAERSGLAAYATRGALPQREIPVRGHVNLIYTLPSYCHAEGRFRVIDFVKGRSISARDCAPVYSMLRRLKQRVPELEITILSGTYGTAGQLGPLQPKEEADTLAKFWLGWHRIPARLVVEEIPFFMVPEPDSRRVDLPTPYAALLQREATFPLIILTDQDGVQIGLLGRYKDQFEAEDNIRLVETLVRRGRK